MRPRVKQRSIFAASLIALALFAGGADAACERRQIVVVQEHLVRLGYDPGPIDGVIGPITRRAIRAMQTAGGLEPHGRIACEDARAASRIAKAQRGETQGGKTQNARSQNARTRDTWSRARGVPSIAFDGGLYQGRLQNGAPVGGGVLIGPGARRYVGDWKDGKYHGRGVLVTETTKYLGDFRNGRFHGEGMLLRPSGVILRGRFQYGEHVAD